VARHNREGKGKDQRGFEYQISYQPDWLRHVKVSRALPSGRQSTMILFRNPCEARLGHPGSRIRTRIVSSQQGLDVEIALRGQEGGVQRVTLTCHVPGVDGTELEEVTFIVEDGLPEDGTG